MDTSIITNFFKKAAKSLATGVAGAISSSDEVRLVPAIAPIPIGEVNEQYGKAEPVERPKKKEEQDKYEEAVKEAVKEIAFKKSMPYQPEVALQKGGIVKRETIAKVGEKEPEIVTPIRNYGEVVEKIYQEGASVIISSSLGFLKSLPPSPAKGTVIAEANRLKSVFGISDTQKPQKVVGLKAPLVWWGSGKTTTQTGAPKLAAPKDTPAGGGGGGMGNPIEKVRRLGTGARKLGKRFKIGKKFKNLKVGKKLRNIVSGGKKAMKGASKVAKSGGKLIKGASKAGKALLKKGAKKVAAKVGGKAIAKVGAKALGKGLLKKIPFVGLGAGLLFAGQRLMAGDFKGAALEAASGIAGTIPGVGTAISVGLDATLAAKDMGVLPDQKKAEQQTEGLSTPDPTKDFYGRPIILNPSTEKAWKKAVNAAAKDGVDLPASVTSSYRSPEQQQALIDAAQAGDPNAISPAAVGTSPHGQGWAVDIDYYSKANEWMRENGGKFGFKWQGENDPVHFDLYNNEPNDKWLRPGKNKWIPNLDPVTTKTKSSGNVKTASGTGDAISAPNTSGAIDTLNEEPVTQGSGMTGGSDMSSPVVVPVPQIKTIYIPAGLSKSEKSAELRKQKAIIDPHGKGSTYKVVTVY